MAELSIALKHILKWEGGYANDIDDSGGPTMCGVTLKTYSTYCKLLGKPEPTVEDLKNISYNEIYDLAKKLYWDKIKGDQINNQSIADLCMNTVWGSGLGYIKIIQKVLEVSPDGIVGPKTLNAINNYTPQEELFNKLWNRRKQYLEGCRSAWKYLRGWLRRLDSFKFYE